MKYILYIFGFEKENDMTIECADEEDLAQYAKGAILQGQYKKVVAVKENEDGSFN